MSDFLGLAGQPILVTGLANRKSVAFHVGRVLSEAGADVLYSVHTEQRRDRVRKIVGDAPVYVCDVASQSQIDDLRTSLERDRGRLAGIVHSIAFADYSSGWLPFHETLREAFLQSVNVSCFSLIALSNACRELLDPQLGSVVSVSISTTRMAAENYGFMAPVKAALDSSVCFLAKSFSEFSQVRFNAVCPGLLKTAASAGIPGYVDSYLFAEQASLRKRAVETEEVANVTAFLLSPRSSGINAQGIVIDAGMSINYFDQSLVKRAARQSLNGPMRRFLPNPLPRGTRTGSFCSGACQTADDTHQTCCAVSGAHRHRGPVPGSDPAARSRCFPGVCLRCVAPSAVPLWSIAVAAATLRCCAWFCAPACVATGVVSALLAPVWQTAGQNLEPPYVEPEPRQSA